MSINLPLKVDNLFCTPVYTLLMPTFLNQLNKISDRYIEEAKKNNEKIIEERNKFMGKDLKDFAVVHHSQFIGNDPELNEFKAFIDDVTEPVTKYLKSNEDVNCAEPEIVPAGVVPLTTLPLNVYRVSYDDVN